MPPLTQPQVSLCSHRSLSATTGLYQQPQVSICNHRSLSATTGLYLQPQVSICNSNLSATTGLNMQLQSICNHGLYLKKNRNCYKYCSLMLHSLNKCTISCSNPVSGWCVMLHSLISLLYPVVTLLWLMCEVTYFNDLSYLLPVLEL